MDGNKLDVVPSTLARLAGTLEVIDLTGNPLRGALLPAGEATATAAAGVGGFAAVWAAAERSTDDEGGYHTNRRAGVSPSRGGTREEEGGGGGVVCGQTVRDGGGGTSTLSGGRELRELSLRRRTMAVMAYLEAHATDGDREAASQGARRRRRREASRALDDAVDAADAAAIAKAVDALRAEVGAVLLFFFVFLRRLRYPVSARGVARRHGDD